MLLYKKTPLNEVPKAVYVVVATFVKPDGAWLGKQNASIWLWDTVWAASASRAWLPLLSLLIAFQLVQARDNDTAALPVIYITCYLRLIYAVLHYEPREALKIKVLSRWSHSEYVSKLLDYFSLLVNLQFHHPVWKKIWKTNFKARNLPVCYLCILRTVSLIYFTLGRFVVEDLRKCRVEFGAVWKHKHIFSRWQTAMCSCRGRVLNALASWFTWSHGEADVNNLL